MSLRRSLWPEPLLAPTEDSIRQGWADDTPIISVLCAVFNHEKSISDCLNGLLSQRTTVPFEIIVRDDCSIDNSRDVIKAFAARYPNIITTIYETSNQFDKTGPLEAMFAEASGMYFAICEGDDFWIDAEKLEDQMMLATKYPNAQLIAAYHWELKKSGEAHMHGPVLPDPVSSRIIENAQDLDVYLHTSTYLIPRGNFEEWIKFREKSMVRLGDTALRYFSLSRGPIIVLNRDVSVYRITGTGIWTSLKREEKLQWELDVALYLKASIPSQRNLHRQRVRSLRISLLKSYVFEKLRSFKYIRVMKQRLLGR